MNMRTKTATAPPFPRIASEAKGKTRPAETSSAVIRRGKVGKTFVFSKATATRPIVVARVKGDAIQARPPRMLF